MNESEVQRAISGKDQKTVRVYITGNDKKDSRPIKQIIVDEVMAIRKVTQ